MTTFEVVTCTGVGLIADATVAVSPLHSEAADWAALLPGDGSAPIAVRLVQVDEVEGDHVVIHEEFAQEFHLEGGQVEIDFTVPVVLLEALTLESTLEEELDSATRRLRAADLSRAAIYLNDATSGGSYVEVDGLPYRVHDLSMPAVSHGACIAVTSERTNIRLFAPGHRTGVDIVILADCSGSMSWDDIEDTADARTDDRSLGRRVVSRRSPGRKTVTRMEALQRALRELLATRLRIDGRLSRIAVARFTTSTMPHFPRDGAMSELHASSAAEIVEEFLGCVSLLRAEDAGTDIGQALHHAAELLHKHGRPGNDRLIVLVSDGADWAPKGVDATGETVRAVADPVSLMSHLHENLGIRLHAIGIGREEDFHSWYKRSGRTGQPHVSVIPNHRLLEELVHVGGGDPSRTGGLDVLEEYFGGLGAGTTLDVGMPRQHRPAEVQSEALVACARAVRSIRPADRDALETRRDQLFERWHLCNELALAAAGKEFFDSTRRVVHTFASMLHAPADDPARFKEFALMVHQTFWENADPRLRIRRGETSYPIPEIARLANDHLAWINDLRNFYAHDPGTRSASQQKKAAETAKRQSELLRALIGRTVPPADDESRGWVLLQIACIDRLMTVLDKITDAFEAQGTKPGAGDAPGSDGERSEAETTGFIYIE